MDDHILTNIDRLEAIREYLRFRTSSTGARLICMQPSWARTSSLPSTSSTTTHTRTSELGTLSHGEFDCLNFFPNLRLTYLVQARSIVGASIHSTVKTVQMLSIRRRNPRPLRDQTTQKRLPPGVCPGLRHPRLRQRHGLHPDVPRSRRDITSAGHGEDNSSRTARPGYSHAHNDDIPR